VIECLPSVHIKLWVYVLNVTFFITLFLEGGGNWNLNSGPHTCKVDVLLLEPLHQSCFVLGIFKIESCELSAQAGFEP
jgi:hypothetical protein